MSGSSWGIRENQNNHKNEIFDMFAFSLLRSRLCGVGCLAWHNTRGLPQPHNAPHCEKLWGFKWTFTPHSTLHVYTTGCVSTLPVQTLPEPNMHYVHLIPHCARPNWQFIWEMWQIYLGAKHLLRLYICRVMMPENKGNWMELYL